MRHKDYDEILDAQSSLEDHGIYSPGLFQFGLPEDPHYTGILPDTRRHQLAGYRIVPLPGRVRRHAHDCAVSGRSHVSRCPAFEAAIHRQLYPEVEEAERALADAIVHFLHTDF